MSAVLPHMFVSPIQFGGNTCFRRFCQHFVNIVVIFNLSFQSLIHPLCLERLIQSSEEAMNQEIDEIPATTDGDQFEIERISEAPPEPQKAQELTARAANVCMEEEKSAPLADISTESNGMILQLEDSENCEFFN